MISWADVLVRQLEHEQKVNQVEQSHWMLVESPSTLPVNRWHWRVVNKLGGWLVDLGCRLQTRAERARQVVRTSPMAMEAGSHTSQPCP